LKIHSSRWLRATVAIMPRVLRGPVVKRHRSLWSRWSTASSLVLRQCRATTVPLIMPVFRQLSSAQLACARGKSSHTLGRIRANQHARFGRTVMSAT